MTNRRNQLTSSVDGTARLDITINYRLDLEELATFITAEVGGDLTEGDPFEDGITPNRAAIKATLTSKQAAVKIAQRCVLIYGTETPCYRVGDGNLEPIHAAVLARLQDLWAAPAA